MAKIPAKTDAPTSSILAQLTVSAEKRGNGNVESPLARARKNALLGIEEQLKHVAAEINGEKYTAQRDKYIDGPDGTRIKTKADKRALLWFWKSGTEWFTEARYGSSAMNFGAGTSLNCGAKLEDVVTTLGVVAAAIRAGELDAELTRLAAKRGKKAAPTS